MGLLPPPWNFVALVAAGYLLRHTEVWTWLTTLLSKSPAPAPAPTPSPLLPSLPAVPAIPGDHPILNDILNRLKNFPMQTATKAGVILLLAFSLVMASSGSALLATPSPSASDSARKCPAGVCERCNCVDESKCPGCCPTSGTPTPFPLPKPAAMVDGIDRQLEIAKNGVVTEIRVLDYDAAWEAVENGETVTLAVGPDTKNADYYTESMPGWDDGLYRCWKQSDGRNKMVKIGYFRSKKVCHGTWCEVVREWVDIPFDENKVSVQSDLPPAVARDALDEVNAARAKRGLRPFIRDENLTMGAKTAAAVRAMRRIAGHLPNDFAYLPAGTTAAAAGCGALDPSWGWGSCCTYENWTYAGAAVILGDDGKRYMHLFVR